MNRVQLLTTGLVVLVLVTGMAAVRLTDDPLDGAKLTVESGGRVRAYRLSAEPEETFELSRASGMVPFTLHVRVTDGLVESGERQLNRFTWDFSDPESRHNLLVGRSAAHVFDRPGVYRIRLTTTDASGRARQVEREIRAVSDQRREIYLSPEGNDANTGLSASVPIRTLERARRAIGNDTRVLLKSGGVYDLSETLRIHGSNVHFTRWGEGERPVIRWKGRDDASPMIVTVPGAEAVTVEGLTFRECRGRAVFHPAGPGLTVRNCRFESVGTVLNANQSPSRVLMMDNECPSNDSLHGYFAWVEGSDHAYIGNTVANSVYEHCIRVGGARRVLISRNRLTNLEASVSGVPGDNAKQTVTVQVGSGIDIEGNFLSWGRLEIGPLGGSDGKQRPNHLSERIRDVVVESNRIESYVQVLHGAQNVVLRNNLITFDHPGAIRVSGFSPEFARGVEDLSIVHNTVHSRSEQGSLLQLNGKARSIELLSNLMVAPKMLTGKNMTAGVVVLEPDLSSFSRISGNVWPVPRTSDWARDGVHYVFPRWFDAKGYRTAVQWLAEERVEGDRFEPVTLDREGRPGMAQGPIKGMMAREGVWTDLNGRPRPASNATPGAVQVAP
jgi:hypothetical protein